MKPVVLTIFFSLSLFIQAGAQSISPGGTEVVVPWATSYYAGLGIANVNFSDSLNGIAYTRFSPDYSITTDGGSNWRTGKRSEQLDRIMLMYSIGRDSLVAVRDSQYIYHSFNGGESWTLANTLWSGERFGYGIFYNHKYGIIFPPEGGFLTSTDLGLTWSARQWNYGEIKSTPRYERGYLFVTEQLPATTGIVFSTNNGISWEKIEIPASLAGYSYAGKSDNGFYVVAANKSFVLISPTGEIVKSFLPSGYNYYTGYAYVSDSEIWNINHQGYGDRELRLYSTTDPNVTVIRLGNNSVITNSIVPTTWDKLVISTSGSNRSSAIMTFNKKGFHDIRVEQLLFPGNTEASTLFFANGSKGFAGLVNKKIIKTTDGGYTWSECTMPETTGVVQKFIQRSESEFIALCGAGLILETSDGGNSWNSIISPMQKTIKGAAFKGRDTIYFCTSDSMFRTTPLWQQITPVYTGLSGGYFTNLDFYDELNGSAIYYYGYSESKAFLTTDGGTSWKTSVFNNRMMTLDPSTIGVYNPSGGFTTWYNDTSGGAVNQDGELKFVNQKPGGLIAVSYSKGDFFYNFGKSANFSRISLGQTFTKNDPVAADANTAYLLTNGGRFFKFYKSTYAPVPSSVFKTLPLNGSPYEYHNISFKWEEPWSVAPILEYNFQLAVDNPSNIIEDVNGITATSLDRNLTADSALYFWRVRARNIHGWGDFNRWYTFRSSVVSSEPKMWQTPLTGYLMTAVILPDGAVVVGDSLGQVARTDSPESGNWTMIDAQTSYPMLRFWRNPNNNLIFAFTLGNRFFFSTNRGVRWYTYVDPFGGTTVFYALTSAPNDRYYGAGQFGTVYKGIMLSPYQFNFANMYFSPYTGSNFAIASGGTNRIAAVGELGSVTLSSDNGVSFTHHVLEPNEIYRHVSFAPDGNLVILNKKGERRVTTDMGINWTLESFETRAPVRDVFTQAGISVIVDEKGGIYTSFSPTGQWYYSRLPEGVNVKSINIGENKILLPSQNGKVFYVPLRSGNPMPVEDESVITDFDLAQNYPNPFNPSTVIGFSVKTPGNYTLEVFNSLGEKVTTLHEGWLEPGKHLVHFNATGLANGIYLYRLRGSEVNITKKMILLK